MTAIQPTHAVETGTRDAFIATLDLGANALVCERNFAEQLAFTSTDRETRAYWRAYADEAIRRYREVKGLPGEPPTTPQASLAVFYHG